MQSVRDAAKKSEKYLAKLEQTLFVAKPDEFAQNKELFTKNVSVCEDCISQLMSSQTSGNITNSE